MIFHFKRQFWISLAIIFGSIIVAAIVISYLAGDTAAKADKIVADRSLIDQQSNALDSIAHLRNQAQQAAAYQAAMDQLLPTQDGLIGFSQWINGLATAHQVAASVSFQGNVVQPAGNSPGQAVFSIEVSGSLDSIVAFLDDAESKAPGFFMQINSFDLIDKDPNYDLTGQGDVLFRP